VKNSKIGKCGLSTCFAMKIEKGDYNENDSELLEDDSGRGSVFVPIFGSESNLNNNQTNN